MALAFTGCADNDEEAGKPAEVLSDNLPSFYGWAVLDDEGAATRGVADGWKVWNKPMAEHGLTVKFLNGTDAYKKFVKDVSKEWEKHGGVRFIWVDDDDDAMIRIKFDNGMYTSWSYTGTDHTDLFESQSQPTMLFARWNRAGDIVKRSDVLRAFGQVLGLELEFRHPDFNPGWDLSAVEDYWLAELNEFIPWSEIQKFVLNPLSSQTSLIIKTDDGYDTESVMTWPLYDMIANNIPVISGDADYNTELSVDDKLILYALYGDPLPYYDKLYFPVIDFSYTQSTLKFNVTATHDLVVIAEDLDENQEVIYLTMPADSTSHTFEFSHSFANAQERKITVAETVAYTQEMPEESYAITKFELTSGNYAKNIDIKALNKAIESIKIIGGNAFTPQVFNFVDYDNLIELYLVQTLDSRAVIKNCDNLKFFSTSSTFYQPTGVVITGMMSPGFGEPIELPTWPAVPEYYHSLSDNGTLKGLEIVNCPELKAISLENVRIADFNFSSFTKLEYIYISSGYDYIVGPYPGTSSNPSGTKLIASLSTLPDRSARSAGNVIVRSNIYNTFMIPPYSFTSVKLGATPYLNLNYYRQLRNWNVVWPLGCEVINY